LQPHALAAAQTVAAVLAAIQIDAPPMAAPTALTFGGK